MRSSLGQEWSPLDEALGSKSWRTRLPRRLADAEDPEALWRTAGQPIVHTLREQLATLGYQDIRSGYDMVVRNRRNTPLYYVVFASKHQLGHTLWKAIARFEPSGQGSLL